MKRLAVLLSTVLAFGCDDEPQLDCADVEGKPGIMFCDDFSDGEEASWVPEGGGFSVSGARYVGEGPAELDGSLCGASQMTASLREGSRSTDVVMHAEMRSLERVDKVLVLRAVDDANRIELNFRAAPYNDLIVQELIDCELVYYTSDGEVVVEHDMGSTLEVDVTLRGNRLIVRRKAETVLDREFDFASTEGAVGVGVIEGGVSSFDSVWVEVL